MRHVILNLAGGDRERAVAFLDAARWPLARGERHVGGLAPGDLALIHVAVPRAGFIARAELASPWRGWTVQQPEACPGGTASGGVLLTGIEPWPRAVPLEAAVQRIDPTASNPQVQANAAGFRAGVVLITAAEYDAVVALAYPARPA